MRPFALAALLFAPPASAGVSYKLPPAGHPVREAVSALIARPPAALRELAALYRLYAAAVAARRDEGWRAGLYSGALIERPDDPALPARQADEAARARAEQVASLEARLARMTGPERRPLFDRLENARQALADARRQASRARGLCIDWSDAVWAELSAAAPAHWSVVDRRRAAAPYHTAVLLCTPPDDPGALCVALDAWPRAMPDVYELSTWDGGSFEGRIPAEFFLHHLDGP